ncbi:MAG: hypothetical protein IPJ58_13170 [Ardenticatenia bacterium]|nr:hypothetical protein [Ardenticatenia bacterium]
MDTLPAGVTFVSSTVSPAGPICTAALRVVPATSGSWAPRIMRHDLADGLRSASTPP